MSNYTSRILRHDEITEPETDWFYKDKTSEPEPVKAHQSVGSILAMSSSVGPDAYFERRTPVKMLADGVPAICDYEPCSGQVVAGSYVRDGRKYTHHCRHCAKHFPSITEESTPKQPCESGYRRIAVDDVLQYGDETKAGNDWRANIWLGSNIVECKSIFRRPINQDGSDTWQMVDGVLARKMEYGEEIMSGDFYQTDFSFMPRNRFGEQVDSTCWPHFRPAPIQPTKPVESEVSHKVTTEPEKRAVEQPVSHHGVLDYFLDRMKMLDLDIREIIADRDQWKALTERQAQRLDNIRAAMEDETE